MEKSFDALRFSPYANPGAWARPRGGVIEQGRFNSTIGIDGRRAHDIALMWKLTGNANYGEFIIERTKPPAFGNEPDWGYDDLLDHAAAARPPAGVWRGQVRFYSAEHLACFGRCRFRAPMVWNRTLSTPRQIATAAEVYDTLFSMRRCRINLSDLRYRLVRRVAIARLKGAR